MDQLKESLKILNDVFGFSGFKEGQWDIIEKILNKKDVIGVLPTGSGKSLSFQLPSIMFKNMTIVLCPLVALMEEQVRYLKSLKIEAIYLNSKMTPKQNNLALEQIKNGKYKILYMSPEKLFSEDFQIVFNYIDVDHIVVDEAHLISQWGFDFRPKYKKIAEKLKMLKQIPVISAFSASATKKDIEEIKSVLKRETIEVVRKSFLRSNIFLDVCLFPDKMKYLRKYLKNHEYSKSKVIIYASTINEVERLYKTLSKDGYKSIMYHGKLREVQRREIKEAYFNDDFEIMIATNAFGMGMDKDNIGLVVHYNMPGSIPAYYQEVGRGGRSVMESSALLLYGTMDKEVQKSFQKSKYIYFRKNQGRKKEHLENILELINSKSCLWREILIYFGELDEKSTFKCHNCINCKSTFEEENKTKEVLMILSTVYGLNKHGVSPNFNLVSEVLKGRMTPGIKKDNIQDLSVFALLKEMDLQEIKVLINEVILKEWLAFAEDSTKLLITNAGAKELKEKEEVFLKIRKI